MKRKITSLAFMLTAFIIRAQVVCTFENFTLGVNSFYKDTNSVPFQVNPASFEYEWTKGTFPYWSGGFSYTNRYDSTTAGFSNIYGVKTLYGHGNSSIYVIGKDRGLITLTVPQTTVEGLYLTNTTYAYEAMKNGDNFCRKFGDTTGTGSGTTIAQGSYPDYFKVIIRGYLGGNLKADSVEYFLADFRSANNSQDYIVKTWNYVNTSTLGAVDSIRFILRSSDVGQWGMNTPAFFGMDNLTVRLNNPVGVSAVNKNNTIQTYPNPFHEKITLSGLEKGATLTVRNISGQMVKTGILPDEKAEIDLAELSQGVYILEITSGTNQTVKRVIKAGGVN